MLPDLFSYYRRSYQRYFEHNRSARILTASAFIFILSILAMGIFVFFKRGFAFMAEDPYFATVATLITSEIALLILFYLFVASALITILFRLFKAREDTFIIASPSYNSLVLFTLVRVALSSLWPVLIIAIPFLLAMSLAFKISVLGFILSFLAILLLLDLSISLSFAVLFLFGRFLIAIKKLTLFWLAFGLVSILLFFIFASWNTIDIRDLASLVRAEDLTRVEADIAIISSEFKYLPTHIVASIFTGTQLGQFDTAILQLFKLLLIVLFMYGVVYWGSRRYLYFWQALQETTFEARSKVSLKIVRRSAFSSVRSSLSALIKKEATSLVRSGREFLWLIFLVLLWLFQVSIDTFIANEHRLNDLVLSGSTLLDIVTALQVLGTVYFMTAIVLRFVLPSFSTERDTAWILATAPISLIRLFRAKLLFFASTFLILSTLVASLHIHLLSIPPAQAVAFFVVVLLSTLWVTVLGLSMGAIYPNFYTNDPGVIATSLSGITFIVVSLVYGALGAFSLLQFISSASFVGVSLFITLSLITGILLVKHAHKRVRTQEFLPVI